MLFQPFLSSSSSPSRSRSISLVLVATLVSMAFVIASPVPPNPIPANSVSGSDPAGPILHPVPGHTSPVENPEPTFEGCKDGLFLLRVGLFIPEHITVKEPTSSISEAASAPTPGKWVGRLDKHTDAILSLCIGSSYCFGMKPDGTVVKSRIEKEKSNSRAARSLFDNLPKVTVECEQFNIWRNDRSGVTPMEFLVTGLEQEALKNVSANSDLGVLYALSILDFFSSKGIIEGYDMGSMKVFLEGIRTNGLAAYKPIPEVEERLRARICLWDEEQSGKPPILALQSSKHHGKATVAICIAYPKICFCISPTFEKLNIVSFPFFQIQPYVTLNGLSDPKFDSAKSEEMTAGSQPWYESFKNIGLSDLKKKVEEETGKTVEEETGKTVKEETKQTVEVTIGSEESFHLLFLWMVHRGLLTSYDQKFLNDLPNRLHTAWTDTRKDRLQDGAAGAATAGNPPKKKLKVERRARRSALESRTYYQVSIATVNSKTNF
ncbi:hypothetical protein J3R30DRAFT_3401568 [Lentinula aciculospora]|uniref:Uncharacterized protein n=1 Tax=Lentinula aciculospora TaxID=153920 RepID=A0A9W9DTI4_9AGAR|nr:hypothetical protein J3R30DRAFT_3401568 [Lentinula aciculospora]